MHVIYLGIDEAGRGAVIGPMVIAFVAVPEEKLEELVSLGVKDSKKLTPKRREELFRQITSRFDRHAVIVTAREIDQRDLVAVSLDEFEVMKMLEGLEVFLEKLIRKYSNTLRFMIYVDAPGSYSTPEKRGSLELIFRAKLASLLKRHKNIMLSFVIEPKADEKYPVVSAASIVAKVIRDKAIEELKRKVGEDFGSGYPSDPKTVGFLEKISGDERPEYVRSSRATAKKIKKGKKSFLEDLLGDDFKI